MKKFWKKIHRFLFVIVMLILSFFVVPAFADPIRVDRENGLAVPNGPNPGDAWDNAFMYLQDAIDYAKDNIPAEIWVRGGSTVPA